MFVHLQHMIHQLFKPVPIRMCCNLFRRPSSVIVVRDSI